MRLIARALLALSVTSLLIAHGGVLLLQKQSGPFLISLFADETPLRAGDTYLSVLVQTIEDRTIILNADVRLRIFKPRHPDIQGRVQRDTVTNKMLYGAVIHVPESGDWNLEIIVNAGAEATSLQVPLTFEPAQPPLVAYWSYFALVPVATVLFILNQWLKRKRSPAPSSFK